MKFSDFKVDQEISGDTGAIGTTVVKILEVDIDNKRLKVQHYTNKVDVWDKEFIEYFICKKIED